MCRTYFRPISLKFVRFAHNEGRFRYAVRFKCSQCGSYFIMTTQISYFEYRIVASNNTCYYSEKQFFCFLKSRIVTRHFFFFVAHHVFVKQPEYLRDRTTLIFRTPIHDSVSKRICFIYYKVASSSMSRLVAHFQIFR